MTPFSIKIQNINETGYVMFDHFKEKNYPWSREAGYHYKTQIIFYNDGVKLKMRVNYELWVKGGNYNLSDYYTKGDFTATPLISTATIKLKQK